MAPVLRWQLNRLGIEAHDEAQLGHIVLVQRERAKTLREMAVNSAFFFRAPASYDEKAVRKHVTAEVLTFTVIALRDARIVSNLPWAC
jgi:glutamyl-tRNA synthetase